MDVRYTTVLVNVYIRPVQRPRVGRGPVTQQRTRTHRDHRPSSALHQTAARPTRTDVSPLYHHDTRILYHSVLMYRTGTVPVPRGMVRAAYTWKYHDTLVYIKR